MLEYSENDHEPIVSKKIGEFLLPLEGLAAPQNGFYSKKN
jgi:hypothetical protein